MQYGNDSAYLTVVIKYIVTIMISIYMSILLISISKHILTLLIVTHIKKVKLEIDSSWLTARFLYPIFYYLRWLPKRTKWMGLNACQSVIISVSYI